MTSRRHITLLSLSLSLLLLSGCGWNMLDWGDGKPRPPNNNYPRGTQAATLPALEPLPSNGIHVVKKGDTLYSIAFRYQLDFRQLASANSIGSDYLIQPGQQLRLTAPTTRARPNSPNRSPQARTSPPTVPPVVATPTPRRTPPPSSQAPSKWRWPHPGPVVANYGGKGNGRAGVDISGKLGDAVIASAGGVVVYSGGGLARYGQLVIIKHGNDFLSAYAYNRKLLVKEGSQVKAGQRIAEMGTGPKGGALLHFEIRVSGKPVDPLKYLPKR